MRNEKRKPRYLSVMPFSPTSVSSPALKSSRSVLRAHCSITMRISSKPLFQSQLEVKQVYQHYIFSRHMMNQIGCCPGREWAKNRTTGRDMESYSNCFIQNPRFLRMIGNTALSGKTNQRIRATRDAMHLPFIPESTHIQVESEFRPHQAMPLGETSSRSRFDR